MTIIPTLFLLVIGLLWCLSGFRYCKQLMSLIGFLVFTVIGYVASGLVTEKPVNMIILALISGVIGAMLAWKLVRIQVFLAGCFCGILIVAGVYLALNDFNRDAASIMARQQPMLTTMICVVAGLFFGYLASSMLKPAIIILSAVSGASLFVQELARVFPMGTAIGSSGVILVAIIGILIQSLSSGGLTDK